MMDAASDLFWPAMLFTLLAVIVAAVVSGRNKGPVPSKCTHQTSAAVVEERAGPEPGASSQYHPEKHSNETRQQLQSGAKILKAKDENLKHVKVRMYSAFYECLCNCLQVKINK